MIHWYIYRDISDFKIYFKVSSTEIEQWNWMATIYITTYQIESKSWSNDAMFLI